MIIYLESEGEAGTVSIISFIGDGGAIDAVYAKDGPLLSISSTMSDIASDVGVSLGEPMFEAMARFRGVMGGDVPPSTCGRGFEAFSGNVVCSYRDHPHLAVLFSGPLPENVPDTWIPESDHELAPRWVAIRHLWLDDPRQYFEAAE